MFIRVMTSGWSDVWKENIIIMDNIGQHGNDGIELVTQVTTSTAVKNKLILTK